MEHEMKGVSVIMPVYNSAQTVGRAIESILHQTLKNFELIIVYDVSDDDSLLILEEFRNRDERIRIIKRKKKEGIAAALNTGLNVAKGKYIARMDADDYSYPDRLEKQWRYMECHPKCVICGGATRVIMPFVSFVHQYPCESEQIKASMLFGCELAHPTVFFRRNVFEENHWRYDEKRFVEDFALWAKIDGDIANLSDVVLDYSKGGGISDKNRMNVAQDSAYVIKEQLKNKLDINVEKYGDAVFWGSLYDKKENIIDLTIQVYELLSEIEHKNGISAQYDRQALLKALCNRWNNFLWEFSLMAGDRTSSFGIPAIGKLSVLCSFDNIMADALGCSKNMIEGVLKDRIRLWIECCNHLPDGYRAVVYGAGVDGIKYFSMHESLLSRVECFCDSRKSLQGTEVLGKEIISPDELKSHKYDIVAVSTKKYFNEIYDYLVNVINVKPFKICSLGIFQSIGK